MGVGRRMGKKQGAPEPLSSEHFAKLKRKAGLPVDEPTEAPAKRRRRGKKNEAEKASNNNNGRPVAQPRQPKAVKAAQQIGAAAVKAKKELKPVAAPESDEEMDDDIAEDDEFSGLDEDELEGAKLGDDFLGSDDDDSVYDSDAEMTGGKKEAFVFSDDEDEDDSDREEKLTAANIVGLSAKLDKQAEEDEEAAEAELRESALQTNIDGDNAPNVLDGEDDSDDELAKSKSLLAPDLQLLRQRITDTIRILEDFANLGAGRSRAEYTAQVLKDVCAYYNYNEFLAEKLYNLFPPREAFAFFEANESPRPVVIRTNTLRTHRRDLAQALINRGVTLEPVGKWSKVGLQIFESTVPLGATPEYLAGHYILQAASSFLPVMALSPQPNERVLDMAAAPGGKTTHCAALMKNTGVIIANDPNKSRAKGLIGNVYRLGAQNVIVCSYDAREFPRVMGGFDRVLLDAPCSGTGVIAKDPSVKTNKTEKDFMVLPHTQKQLLLSAIDSVNHHSATGGYLVYSTCSVTVEENEEVVAYALSRRPNVKLVETGLPFGKEGFTSYMGKKFDQSLKLTRRYYPHTYNVDGFFVAKFKKIGPTPANAVLAPEMKKAGASPSSAFKVAEEYVDRTPVTEEAEQAAAEFGGFDEGEDKEYIERAKKNAMRRRGLDPKALNRKASKEGLNGAAAKKAEEKTEKPKEKAEEKVEEAPKEAEKKEEEKPKALKKKASKENLKAAAAEQKEEDPKTLKKKASKQELNGAKEKSEDKPKELKKKASKEQLTTQKEEAKPKTLNKKASKEALKGKSKK